MKGRIGQKFMLNFETRPDSDPMHRRPLIVIAAGDGMAPLDRPMTTVAHPDKRDGRVITVVCAPTPLWSVSDSAPFFSKGGGGGALAASPLPFHTFPPRSSLPHLTSLFTTLSLSHSLADPVASESVLSHFEALSHLASTSKITAI